jgi:hypothetical protein
LRIDSSTVWSITFRGGSESPGAGVDFLGTEMAGPEPSKGSRADMPPGSLKARQTKAVKQNLVLKFA